MKKIYSIRACNSAFFSIFHLHCSKFCSISNKIVGGLIFALTLLNSISVKGQLPDDFQQVPLLTGLANATTMQFAPDGRIFILDRYGEVIIYKTDTQTSVSAGTVPVFHEFEEGLLGIAFDPDFITNNYIYLHYAVLGQSTNRVSRFTMNGDVLDMSSEIVMLEWGTQRIISYHSGGDMAFDSQGNLYIAVGDNSYYSDAYASHNETDISATTEKSSSNTNDMRGKILRITPQNDGSYTIPAGNLFPAGTPNTLPEIYVMGARNPYRIFVDKENTDWLFWGEVGPDANTASALGPEGLDEMNLTKASGNYGWPYFSGVDNDAYQVAYRTPSPFYNDPAAPENTSTWNTGATVLPPAQPAWLEFFHKSHFAGPRYYYDGALTDDQRFPVEFDEIFFYYDFNSSKIWAVEMDAQGNIISNDLFAPAVFPSGSGDGFIDMEFGPDGKMYILAYGAGCCPQNAGTGKLIRVDYTGITSNAPPTVMISADPNSGPLPLTVNFSSAGTNDPNGDTPLTYEWDFDGDGNTDSNDENPTHVYNTAGTFNVKLTVTDPGGAFGVNNITIYAGNTAATFSYNLPPDGGFIGWGDDVSIDLIVSDTEDGSTGSGIDCNDVNVVPALGHLNHFHDLATMTGCTQNFNLGYDGHDITGEMDIFYVLNANYTDQGGLTAFDQILLHPKRKEAEYFDTQNGTTIITNTDFLEGGSEALSVDNNGYISFSERNLLNMTAVKYKVAAATAGGTIEFRLGSPTGTLLATTTVPSTGGLGNWQAVESIFSAPVGKNDLFFVFKSTSGTQDIFNLNYVEFIGDGVSTDSSPPEISSVEAMGSTQVKVQFSEYVTAATANQVSNYVIDNGIAISSAVLQSDGLTVFLTVSPLSGDTTYNLTVNDVQNISGIPIVTEDYSFSIISSIRINVGGPQLTYGAETFIADQYSTGGSLFSASMPINGTTQDELYQTERFGSFSYEIPVPVSGEYDIRLHFAELYFGIGSVPGGPGTRVFNVTIEGNPVLTNFDISAEVDPATALQKELDDISITDGFASITLTSINENPKLSAIEILPPDAFASTPDIMITSPQNGWSVNQPFEVAFMVENWTIQEGDTHIHYYIDGVMVEPYYSHDPIPLDNLSIGSHTIRVELFFANHSPTGIFDEVMVAVTEQSVCNETDFPDSWIVHQLDQNPYTAVYTFADDDLDGDGLKDIVTGGWWYKNSGSASSNWQKSTIGGTFGNVVHVHDFDGDGDIDLLGTALGIAPDNEYESAQLLWAQNDGSGNFTVFTNIPAGNTNYSEPFLAGLAGGDFGAGYQMAINWNGAESTGSPVQMLTPSANPTTGIWSLVDISPDSAGEDLQAGDIDGDGDLDLFQGVNWLRNNGGGTWETFSTGITYVTTPDRAQLADFDRDGDLDAVVGQLGLGSNPNNSEFAWFAAPADPTQPWVRNILATDIAGSLSVFAIDFDFDGDQDIVVGEWLADRRLIVFENDLCSTGDWETQIIDDGSLNLEHHDGARVTDIDNDGDLDVVSNGWLQHMGPRIYENTTPPPVSNEPEVDAGEDQIVVLPTDSLTLNGSASDPDGGSITAYQWTQVSGPTTATLAGEATADLTASGLVLGIYVFRLNVIDDENETGFDEVTVTVSPEGGNMPPVAVAEAAPLTGVAPLEVTFTGSNSTDDVGVVTYAWDFGDGGTSTEGDPTYTYNTADTYTVTLTVTDGGDLTSTATLSITVTDGTSGKMEVILAENPSKGGVAKIRVINAPADMVVLKIYLHDVGGRYIAVYNAPDVLSADGTYDIPASTLRDGVYFVGVEMNQGKPTLIKLIVDN